MPTVMSMFKIGIVHLRGAGRGKEGNLVEKVLRGLYERQEEKR